MRRLSTPKDVIDTYNVDYKYELAGILRGIRWSGSALTGGERSVKDNGGGGKKKKNNKIKKISN